MKEKWIRLTIPGLINKAYCIKTLLDDYNGLKITMWNGKKNGKLILIFFEAVESYQYCDEHSKIDLWSKLNEIYGKDFYVNDNFFEIKNSNYINWLNKSSYGITEGMGLKHYVLMDKDSVIDIISYGEPKFKELD